MILLLTGACAPLAPGLSSTLAGSNIEGYEAPGGIDYPPALLEKVASALSAQGRYRRGPVYGIAMQNALRGLQSEKGLPATGLLDIETLIALRIDPALLPDGLPPVHPGPYAGLLSGRDTLAAPETSSTEPPLPEHSPGRFSVRSPLIHLAAPVAALVEGDAAFCTGFLIGPDNLVTTAGCLAGSSCERLVARFNFQEDARGRPLSPTDYQCMEVLEIDAELDYALVRLAGEPGYDWGYLEWADDRAEEGEPLAVVGHPAGTGKRIFEKCRAAPPEAGREFGLFCDAELDLPGAPVISLRNRRVVAMLPAGTIVPEKKGKGIGSGRILDACRTCEPLRLGGGRLDLGDGKEYFLQQGGRLGLLRSDGDGWKSEWLPSAWLDQWSLPGRYRAYAADIDGDGAGELLLKNSRWLAIFRGGGGQPRLHWIVHDRIGNWQLGGEDRAWPGDFDGDGRGDLLVYDGRRLGLLLATGRKLSGPWRSGRKLGEWQFEPADRFTVGDFDGDGRDDVLARRGAEAAVFLARGKGLVPAWSAASRLGFWNLAAEDEYHVGDFTGDGCDEVLVRRDREMALWKMAEDGMEVQWRQRRRIGSWRLGWQDRLHIGDFNGDGRDDILIRSNEWIGLLVSSGRFFTTPWLRFDRFPGWDLTPFDRELVGDFNGDGKAGVLIFNHRESGRFLSSGAALIKERSRQEAVVSSDP